MSNLKKKRNDRANAGYRPLAIAALVAGGTFQLIAPALAAPGGIDIVNRATATYTDGATEYSATSNTVTIRVNEVAGITISASTPSSTSAKPGDKLFVDFTITNTGFDPTQFFIPDTATLSDAANFKIDGSLKVMTVNGVAQNGTTGVSVPTGGGATGDIAKFTFTGAGAGGSIPPNSTVVVRVPIEVLGSALTTNTLKVSLGETIPVDTNNLVRVVGTKDVYTVDNPDGVAGEYTGTPVDVREAMASSATIAVAARYQAFAAVLKANGGYSNNSTPNVLTDDTLTYNLALKVDNPSTPPAGLAPSDLYGTAISVDGSSVNAVLVSDAIPVNTQLASVIAPPSNWQTVYTTSLVTTTAQAATWSTTAPSTPAQFAAVTRVGFIYKTDASPTGNGPIAKSTTAGAAVTVSGFSFTVTPKTGFTGGQIANMAQVFGQSQPGASVADTATQIVYDESGDQSYNNTLGGTNPTPLADAAGGINTGVADPTKDGTDPGTGTDPTNTTTTNIGVDGADLGGETTVYTIATTPFTGPSGAPEAVGPSPDPDKNKDYTNLSIVLPVGLDPATALTDAQTPEVVFANSVKNASTASQTISLRPSLPTSLGANERTLPNGTTVTIDPDGAGAAAGVVFTYTTASGFTPAGATPTVTVNAGATQAYTVTINLPSGEQLKGYPVVINAFVDGNGDGLVGANEPSNQTIDSYYTGYLKLLKDARIQSLDGLTIYNSSGGFTTDATELGLAAQPGRVVKYRIRYENISSGNELVVSGNKSLSANALTIKEDGADGTNTWFTSTNDTVSPISGGNGSLVAPGGSTITTPLVTNGTVPNDIQVYTVNVGTVAPGSSNQVTFDRKIKQ